MTSLSRIKLYGLSAKDHGTRSVFMQFIEGLTEEGAEKMLQNDVVRKAVEEFEKQKEYEEKRLDAKLFKKRC